MLKTKEMSKCVKLKSFGGPRYEGKKKKITGNELIIRHKESGHGKNSKILG